MQIANQIAGFKILMLVARKVNKRCFRMSKAETRVGFGFTETYGEPTAEGSLCRLTERGVKMLRMRR